MRVDGVDWCGVAIVFVWERCDNVGVVWCGRLVLVDSVVAGLGLLTVTW